MSVTPACSAEGAPCTAVFSAGVEIMYALSAIPFANRPRASGEVIRYITLSAPADSPAMVTLAGSPPKAAMFSFTHVSARI